MEQLGEKVPDNPVQRPAHSRSGKETQTDDTLLTDSFPSFEVHNGIEFSFNGQATARKNDWECVISLDGKELLYGLRVSKIIGLYRKMTGTRPSDPMNAPPAQCSLRLLKVFASRTPSGSDMERKIAELSQTLLAEVHPVLARLHTYSLYRNAMRNDAQRLFA